MDFCCANAGGGMSNLDETDERILAELAQDARATFAEVGQRMNLSAPAVKRLARTAAISRPL